MDGDTQALINTIESEIKRIESHMYNKLGLDRSKVEELYKKMDKELEKRIEEQFENLAEIKGELICQEKQ